MTARSEVGGEVGHGPNRSGRDDRAVSRARGRERPQRRRRLRLLLAVPSGPTMIRNSGGMGLDSRIGMTSARRISNYAIGCGASRDRFGASPA